MSETDGFDETRKGMSIAGLVLGIVSLVFFFIPFIGLITGIIAIVLSAISLKQKKGLKGLCIAGLVLGIISVGIMVLMLVIVGGAIAAVFGITNAAMSM